MSGGQRGGVRDRQRKAWEEEERKRAEAVVKRTCAPGRHERRREAKKEKAEVMRSLAEEKADELKAEMKAAMIYRERLLASIALGACRKMVVGHKDKRASDVGDDDEDGIDSSNRAAVKQAAGSSSSSSSSSSMEGYEG